MHSLHPGYLQAGGLRNICDLLGYFLPTKLAGPTNIALALINFPDLAAYEKYREALLRDTGAAANVAAVDASQAILIEDRSFLRRVPE